jgi:starvation-inducible DNA-binding protein
MIDEASAAGDHATADIFTEVSRGIDKSLWMVEAHLQTGDALRATPREREAHVQ